MKTWMKIAMWLGLGGGIGFFAGYQIGQRSSDKEHEDDYSTGYHDAEQAYQARNQYTDVNSHLNEYRGEDFDGDSILARPFDKSVLLEEDPPMPVEPPVIGDEEDIEVEPIRQLHATHMNQKQITEEDYWENPWQYDKEELIFYEGDQALLNRTTRERYTSMDEIEQTIGIGMITAFYPSGKEDLDTIFVKNDTAGVLYRIDRIEESLGDILSGADAPDYEEDDDAE